MKFKIDENLPVELVQVLHASGHDAITVLQQAMKGANDPNLMETCRAEERVLVTLDLDFANIHAYPPHSTPGVIALRVSRQDKPCVMKVFDRVVPLLEKETLKGRLWIVEESRVRIRE